MSHHEIKVRQGQIFFAKIEQIFKFLCRSEIHHSQFDDGEVWSMLLHTFWYIIGLSMLNRSGENNLYCSIIATLQSPLEMTVHF